MKGALGLFVLLPLALGNAWATTWFGGRLSIGGGYGRAYPDTPTVFKDAYEDGLFWTGHLKYHVNDTVSLVASYADITVAHDPTNETIRFQPIIGSIRAYMFRGLPVSPYLTAGAGISVNRRDVRFGETIRWEKPSYQGGVGLEFFINDGASLGAEGIYHYIRADGDNDPYRLVSVAGMVNLYFGEGPGAKKQKKKSEEAQRAAEEANAKAAQAQQETEKSLEQQQSLQAQTTAAKQAADAAAVAKAEAERKAQDMQARSQQAQAEVDRLKQMVSQKEIPPIAFATGRADLLASSYETLNKVAEVAKRYPDLKLRVEGHTDSTGSDSTNQKLSQDRAESVKDYLISQGSLPETQVAAVGFGETRPIAPNTTAEGRTQNRRVEFIFFLP